VNTQLGCYEEDSMMRISRIGILSFACAAGLCLAIAQAHAGTIIKLGLGGDPTSDVMLGGGILSTASDGNLGTLGHQDTNVDYSDFLIARPDIIAPPASFTLAGLTLDGPATLIAIPPNPPFLVIQNFMGGTFDLYDQSNVLLLHGVLAKSAISGSLGPPSTGALFTTSFSDVTAGTLKPLIKPGSLTLSMSLSAVNGTAGFTVSSGDNPVLNAFAADATINIAAEPVPEPSALLLAFIGGATAAACMRQHRS
jgi:hypothetical protein